MFFKFKIYYFFSYLLLYIIVQIFVQLYTTNKYEKKKFKHM